MLFRLLQAEGWIFPLLLVLYLGWLGATGLHSLQEGCLVESARQWWHSGLLRPMLPLAWPADIAPVSPLLLWLTGLCYQWLGLSLAAARLVSALGALLAMVAAYALGQRLFHSRIQSLMAAVCVATSWGLFQAGRTAGDEVWFVALPLLWLLLIDRWLAPLYSRFGKRAEGDLTAFWVGVLWAILLLVCGLPGGFLAGGLLLLQAHYRAVLGRLEGLSWERVLAGFLLMVALGWFLGAAEWIFDLDWGYLAYPNQPWISRIERLLPAALVDLFPWNFFVVATLLDVVLHAPYAGQSLSARIPKLEGTLLLTGWSILALATYVLASCFNAPAATLMLWPGLLMLTGAFVGSTLEKIRLTPGYSAATDGTVLTLLALAIGATVVIFFEMPNPYPGSVWSLPGRAFLHHLQFGDLLTLKLPEAFPVWKLWLVPLPLLLILGALSVFACRLFNRASAAGATLSVWVALWLLYVACIALPIVQRPLERSMTLEWWRLASVASEKSRVEYVAGYPSVFAPFFLEEAGFLSAATRLQQPKTAAELLQLTLLTTAMNPTQPALIGLTSESAYYRLPPAMRQHIRVLKAEPRWHWPWYWRWTLRNWNRNNLRWNQTAVNRYVSHQFIFEWLPTVSLPQAPLAPSPLENES
ncbi:MAG: hypothetical protein SFZ03_09765 [Candidatus Melainabacteria bacterium]|nr:hypothetical protein [Candidatus Melainabacteria bacterium]